MDRYTAPHLAGQEEARADQTVSFIANVAGNPGNATHNSLPLYQDSAHRAYETSAKFTEQPKDRP